MKKITFGLTVLNCLGKRHHGKCVFMHLGEGIFSTSSTVFPKASFHSRVSLPSRAVNLSKIKTFCHINLEFEKVDESRLTPREDFGNDSIIWLLRNRDY